MHDIPVVFHFMVEVAGFTADEDIRFQEVTGLSGEVSTEEFREGGLNEYAHRIPTGAKYGNLVLKRGFASGSSLIAWCRKAIEDFSFEPKDVTVSLLGKDHMPLAAWSFQGAYPAKWSISDLKAQENAVAIESLELVYRQFRKV